MSMIGKKLIDNPELNELVERCLGYFSDRLYNEGDSNPDVEYLMDDMMVTEQELKEMFHKLGYDPD